MGSGEVARSLECIVSVVLCPQPSSVVLALSPAQRPPPSPLSREGPVPFEGDPYQVLVAVSMTCAYFPPLLVQIRLVALFADL